MRQRTLGVFLAGHGLLHAAAGMSAQDAASGRSWGELALATALFLCACPGFVAAGAAAWLGLGRGGAWRRIAAPCLLPSAMLLLLTRPVPLTVAAGVLGDLAVALVLMRGGLAAEKRAGASSTERAASWAAAAPAVLCVLGLAALVGARPWFRSWGAVGSERHVRLPGDEHAGNPSRASDRAITIMAPADAVWPWVRQLGQDRAGFYSYAGLERACGIEVTNADRIVPAWQTLRVGDFVPATQSSWAHGLFGERIGWEVDHVDDERHLLALRYWIFEVTPVDARTSRLHVRTHAGDAPLLVAPILLLTFEPIHFVMERAMLRGIKERAEREQLGRP